MARINIEEESWQRFYKMAEFTNTTMQECIGVVACLWHQSQDFMKVSGSKEEIFEWSGLFRFAAESSEKYFFALKKARFISEQELDQFLIHGNETQIESRVKHVSKSAKGGKALKKKLTELKRRQAQLRSATGTPEEGLGGLNAIQYNTKQTNTKQGKQKRKASPKSALRESIEEIYTSHYPKKEGKQRGIETLVKDLKSPDELNLLREAVLRYKATVVQNKIEPKFIKHFSTFASAWREWTDLNAGKLDIPAAGSVQKECL